MGGNRVVAEIAFLRPRTKNIIAPNSVVLVNCQLVFKPMARTRVASPFALPLGETDPAGAGPVRAKEWARERVRVAPSALCRLEGSNPSP